jgi:hypothetical protein
MPIGERNHMLREELLEQIGGLPAGTEVGIQLGGELFGIENLHEMPADGETFGMLTCSMADFRSMLHDWGYGPEQIDLIMAGEWAGGLSVPEPRGVQAAHQGAKSPA